MRNVVIDRGLAMKFVVDRHSSSIPNYSTNVIPCRGPLSDPNSDPFIQALLLKLDYCSRAYSQVQGKSVKRFCSIRLTYVKD